MLITSTDLDRLFEDHRGRSIRLNSETPQFLKARVVATIDKPDGGSIEEKQQLVAMGHMRRGLFKNAGLRIALFAIGFKALGLLVFIMGLFST